MSREYYLKNREKIIAQVLEYRKRNPEKAREWGRRGAQRFSQTSEGKAYRAKWMREWRKNNPEKAKAVEKRRPPRPREHLDKKNAKQREKYDPMKEREDRIELKRGVFAAYGGAFCQCCPESHPDKYVFEFLTVDHVNGGGNQHRKEIGVSSGDGFYKWLRKNNYPTVALQILCFNCNNAKRIYGKCPHQTF